MKFILMAIFGWSGLCVALALAGYFATRGDWLLAVVDTVAAGFMINGLRIHYQ